MTLWDFGPKGLNFQSFRKTRLFQQVVYSFAGKLALEETCSGICRFCILSPKFAAHPTVQLNYHRAK